MADQRFSDGDVIKHPDGDLVVVAVRYQEDNDDRFNHTYTVRDKAEYDTEQKALADAEKQRKAAAEAEKEA